MYKPRRLLSLLFCTALLGSNSLTAQSLNDPMRPPSETVNLSGKKATKVTDRNSGLYLSAIRIGKNQRSATINGKNLNLGEYIGNAKIIAIQGSSVTLQQAGKTRTLSLLPLSIKTPVEANQP